MNARRIGSLVGLHDREVIGIFTERDILVRVVAACRNPETTAVGEVMTAPVVCCTPEAEIQECKELVTNQRLRHIPVVENGRLVGLVTSGDILAREAFERDEAIEPLTESSSVQAFTPPTRCDHFWRGRLKRCRRSQRALRLMPNLLASSVSLS